jgi:hypothetical protein
LGEGNGIAAIAAIPGLKARETDLDQGSRVGVQVYWSDRTDPTVADVRAAFFTT